MQNEKLARKVNEDYFAYLERLYTNRDEYEIYCEDIAKLMNEEFGLHYGECKYRKEIKSFIAGREYEREHLAANNRDAYIEELCDKKRELELERKKLQTEKIENNKWLRDYARNEMLMERIIDAVEKNKWDKTPPKRIEHKPNDREYVLAFGDAHYGKEFVIYGLNGEVINSYSPEIFEMRMWDLLTQTIDIIKKEHITKLNVYELGDFADGILRVSALMQLRYGVVESAIRYANFMVDWLSELTEHTRVCFQMTKGNHTELRMLGQPKGTFSEDNMAEVVREIIRTNLIENPNFEMTVNATGLVFDSLVGYNILGVHGDCGNLNKTIQGISETYKTTIDYMIGGHFHHRKVEDVGRQRGVISVKSIIGIDDYSMSLNKTSDAGASLVVFERGKGDVIHYNMVLN